MLRTYEIRTYAKNAGEPDPVHIQFEARDKAAARELIAQDNARFLPLEASQLFRLANPEEGEERLGWSYPAAFDLTEGGRKTGLMREDEDF